MGSSATVVAKHREHLKQLINRTINKQGPDCDLNFIDVSKVMDMSRLFARSGFDGDISNWDVSKVRKMGSMFIRSNFEGDIDRWNVSSEADTFEIFRQSMLEKKGKLPKWNDGPVYENPPGVIFSWP